MDDMAREDVFLFIQARKYGIDRQAKAVCQNICRYFWEDERNGPWFCGKAGKCVSEKEWNKLFTDIAVDGRKMSMVMPHKTGNREYY